MNIIIIRGGSGAGKSTWAKTNYPNATVLSADAYFVEDGVYNFDKDKLGDAHAWCLRGFIESCQATEVESDHTVVVDNTNTSIAEFAPYMQVALAYGHSAKILTWAYDPYKAHARNTHGTPLEICVAQYRRLCEQTALIPSWWEHGYVVALGINDRSDR